MARFFDRKVGDRYHDHERPVGERTLTDWNEHDLSDLELAFGLLENPGLIAKISDLIGTPIEVVLKSLPKGAGEKITRVTHDSLMAAVNLAVKTMDPGAPGRPRSRRHAAMAGLAGGVGGAFGLIALPIELPITTTVIMRSIADIARSEGEDLRRPESRLACLEVFAMGGPTDVDDAAESGYFAVRTALAQAVSEAARYVARRAVVEDGAPVLVRLLAQIAARFNAVVGEKIMAQGVPIVGAVGGATINVLFIEHFQDMARGHFIIRRLERIYGEDEVRQAYGGIIGRR
jgi:hypothetical protein